MIYLVLLFGALTAALGAFGLIQPAGLMRFIRDFWRSPKGLHLAIGIRVVLGIALLLAAPESRFPAAFRVLGIISLGAATAALFLGFERLRRFVDWWVGRSAGFVRGWSVFALAFGIFLIYGALT